MLIFLTYKQIYRTNSEIKHSYVFFHFEQETKSSIKSGTLEKPHDDFFWFIKHFIYYLELFFFNLENPKQIPEKYFQIENFIKSLYVFHLFLNLLLKISFTFLLILLNGFHFGVLLSHNRTTIEFCDTNSDENKYDQGCFKNYFQVFGQNLFFWLFPFKISVNSSSF